MITLGGTRTPNLRFRRPTPYPLGHEGLLRKLRRFFERNSIICLSQCWEYWILEIIDQIVQKLLLTATRIIILETLFYAASKCALQICTNKLLWNYLQQKCCNLEFHTMDCSILQFIVLLRKWLWHLKVCSRGPWFDFGNVYDVS